MTQVHTNTVHEYILFRLQDKWMAILSSSLLEVLEPVHVSPLPMVPDFVNGLINVSGSIIPQIDLASFIAKKKITTQESLPTLLIVLINNSPVALKVGMLQEPVMLDDEQLQQVEKNEGDLPQCFSHTFSYQQQTASVFSLSSLEGVVSSDEKPEGKKSFLGELDDVKNSAEVTLEYLKFRCDEQVYACKLDAIHEVVDVKTINKQPGSADSVLGVALIRDMPTLVMSLKKLLQDKLSTKSDAPDRLDERDFYSLLLIRREGIYCALLVDEVIGLEMVKPDQIRQGQHAWQQVILSADGDTLAQSISMADFFDEAFSQQYQTYMPSLVAASTRQQQPQAELLRFFIGDDFYAFYLKDVRRILNDKTIQPLLERQAFLSGAIEYEGAVIPVIDLHHQLGYEGESKAYEFIVMHYEGGDWALAIDDVDQIITVDEDSIDALTGAENAHQKNFCIQAYVTYQQRLLSILDVATVAQINLQRAEVG